MRKISERKLKEFENEVQRAVDKLFKNERGLESLDINWAIHVNSKKLFDKIDEEIQGDSNTNWKWLKITTNRYICLWPR